MIFAVVNAVVIYAIAEKSQKRKKGRPNRIRNISYIRVHV